VALGKGLAKGSGRVPGRASPGLTARSTRLRPSGAHRCPAAWIEFLFPYPEQSWEGRADFTGRRGGGSLGRTDGARSARLPRMIRRAAVSGHCAGDSAAIMRAS